VLALSNIWQPSTWLNAHRRNADDVYNIAMVRFIGMGQLCAAYLFFVAPPSNLKGSLFFTFVTAFLASSCSSGLDCGSWMYYCQVFIAAVSFIAWTYGAGSDQDKALSGKAGVFAYRMLNAAFFAWCMHVLVFGKDPNMGSLRSGDNWTADNTYVHRMWALHVAMFAISSRWTPYSDLRQWHLVTAVSIIINCAILFQTASNDSSTVRIEVAKRLVSFAVFAAICLHSYGAGHDSGSKRASTREPRTPSKSPAPKTPRSRSRRRT